MASSQGLYRWATGGRGRPESDDKDFLVSQLQPGLPRVMKQAFELPEQAIESPLTVVVPEKGFWAARNVRVQVSVR